MDTRKSDVAVDGEVCSDSTRVVQHSETSSRDPEYQQRLKSFEGWSYRKSRTLLASAGFVYTGIADKVECATCGIKLYNWQEHEDPLKAHKKYAPDCGFMSKYHPEIPVTPKPKEILSVKYPQYSTYEARLQTYSTGWPLTCVVQKPDIMARSGFYYIGSADRARCFHCGVTLRDWDTDDYPPSSHQQWSQNCPFVMTLNVPALRTEIEELEKAESMRIEYANSTFEDCSSSKHKQSIAPTPVVPTPVTYHAHDIEVDAAQETVVHEDCPSTARVHSQVSDQSNDHLATNPAVQTVVEFGFPLDKVLKVLEHRRGRGHSEVPSAIDLYQLVEAFD